MASLKLCRNPLEKKFVKNGRNGGNQIGTTLTIEIYSTVQNDCSWDFRYLNTASYASFSRSSIILLLPSFRKSFRYGITTLSKPTFSSCAKLKEETFGSIRPRRSHHFRQTHLASMTCTEIFSNGPKTAMKLIARTHQVTGRRIRKATAPIASFAAGLF